MCKCNTGAGSIAPEQPHGSEWYGRFARDSSFHPGGAVIPAGRPLED